MNSKDKSRIRSPGVRPALRCGNRILTTPDRMCSSPPVYTTTTMAENMAATRERTRSGSSTPCAANGSSDAERTNGSINVRPSIMIDASAASIGNAPRTFLIGVAGGTASGKSTVCKKIIDMLEEDDADNRHRVDIISQECFYRELSEKEQHLAAKGQFDFDHPSAFDEKLMVKTIQDLKAGRNVTLPEYDYVNNCGNWKKPKVINPADVILFEGILTFYFKDVRDEFNMKLFVDTDADTRLSRRVMRDMQERGRPLETILAQYINFVKPAFEEFCLPTKKYADVIIPRGADNIVAIDLIVQHIQDLLKSSRNGAQLGTNTITVATSPDPTCIQRPVLIQ